MKRGKTVWQPAQLPIASHQLQLLVAKLPVAENQTLETLQHRSAATVHQLLLLGVAS
jgi:hypothetical protein